MLKFTIKNGDEGTLNVLMKDSVDDPKTTWECFKIYLGKSFKISFKKPKEFESIEESDFTIYLKKITESNDFKQAIKEHLKSFTENYRLIHLGNLDGYCLVNLDDTRINIESDAKEVSFLVGRHGTNIDNIKKNYNIKSIITITTRGNDFEQDDNNDNNDNNDIIVVDNREKAKETLQVDDKVLVWNNDDPMKLKRHFSRFNDEGKMCTFKLGATSWSSNNGESVWDNYLIINKD